MPLPLCFLSLLAAITKKTSNLSDFNTKEVYFSHRRKSMHISRWWKVLSGVNRGQRLFHLSSPLYPSALECPVGSFISADKPGWDNTGQLRGIFLGDRLEMICITSHGLLVRIQNIQLKPYLMEVRNEV